MEVNEQVVSQGIVVAIVMAGFAFVIAADIVLRDPLPEELQVPAFAFLVTGLFGILTAAAGVLYFGNAQVLVRQDELDNIFLKSIGTTGMLFLISIVSLFWSRLAGSIRWQFVVVMVMIVAVLILGTYR